MAEPIKTFIVLDTETVGLKPRNIIYDIGWQVVDRFGTVYDKQNYLVREVITNPDLMMGAYFAKKIFSFYIEHIESQAIIIKTWGEIADLMRASFNRADVLTAYNLPFDMNAVRQTHKVTNHRRAIFDRAPTLLDLWYFSCIGALNSRLYWDLAEHMGWKSEAGNYRTTAETTYRFLTGNWDFIESHTALSDAEIETEILTRLLAKKQTIPYNEVKGMPWRLAQPAKGEMI